ncbi:MAG: dTDP-4-amino-4,6-dideoxygalactose transaminase [Microscillaceae bacterium]|nr:dTDP-4-amino-4,6-dideoxygalactose transaminase [Microscillaceae bacterium]MDW8461459.1 dTDP-4-amino-4,6-dideoxygalactose transaminase [Cytophagales bacterium]
MTIGFNKPYFTGKETSYILEAVRREKISGNGYFTQLCHDFFEKRYGFKKVLLTNSCTDALEMAAILIDVQPDDEVIIPAYTFVSTANAFVLRGAKIIFADSYPHHPNLNADSLEPYITPRTKAIVVVHYAGIACDMDKISELAQKYNLFVVEDAAQAINGFYKGKPLGSFGHLGCFSFHETKNIISGEGGMLVINDERFMKRAEIIWEKGTNRAAFFRGEIDKYGWVDIGSSFLPSELIAAFLYAQLEKLDQIQEKRQWIWQYYYQNLEILAQKNLCKLPYIPEFSTNNAHIFYLLCQNLEQRTALIEYLKKQHIQAVFHYLNLQKSPFYTTYQPQMKTKELTNADYFADSLVRLPMYYELTETELDYIIQHIKTFFTTSFTSN